MFYMQLEKEETLTTQRPHRSSTTRPYTAGHPSIGEVLHQPVRSGKVFGTDGTGGIWIGSSEDAFMSGGNSDP